jgi:glycerol uptake facilitator-like aquaporin
VPSQSLARRLTAEGLGTGLLLAAIVGSGIMGERLSGGISALALFCNSTATGAMLIVLIGAMGPVSGAHFNPLVTIAFLLRREIERHTALAYIVVQIAGAVLGTWAAHLMFGVAPFELATKFGLILTIFGALRWRAEMVPTMVGLYIAAAYWFTASTSFANPAVTIARALTDTFTGIAPSSVPAFIAAQTSGALVGLVLSVWLFGQPATQGEQT